ncbi:MAG: MG2 domain-containing protein, partial [Patescibacteria group bacterium]|nr:MG2 domain-containing protein [Patescibacteria group bacterium]
RGPKRGDQGGNPVNSVERDRVRALQLMTQAWPLARQDDHHAAVGGYLLSMARVLLNNRGFSESWRLQYLTDLSRLPDYEDGWHYGSRTGGAPVDEDGNPVMHHVPKSLEDAETDGQRWRWCLEQAIEFSPQLSNGVRSHFADFLLNQFGVQTMADFGGRFGRGAGDGREAESGTWSLHTLGENETIARLATGVKRFELPDEFNFISIYRKIAETPQAGQGEESLRQLAQIFENRRQYPKAAETWQRLIAEFPASGSLRHYQERLSQIADNWGQFEPVSAQPAGKGATVEFRFRNGHIIELKAHAIKVEQLLRDVKDYLKSNPGQIDRRKADIGDVGYRLVRQNEEKYRGDEVAKWKMVVMPRAGHFDKRVTITTPLQTPGAYLLEATMKGGNTSYIVLWVADTAIIQKPLEGKSYYFVADAVTGAPVAKANVEFFGWRMEYRGKPGRPSPRDYQISVKQFAEHAGADGQLFIDERQAPTDYQWLVTARTEEGRFAYLGFSGVWYTQMHDLGYHAVKVFPMTDRPVYRPEQKVHFKFWVGRAQYDQEDASQFAGQSFTVEIADGRGENVLEKTYTADEYGGFEGELALPKDATLGSYGMSVRQGDQHFGGGQFRVEEYKKPEFEVSIDAPSEPIMLGEVIEATINAKYYFGSPVTSAKVKYKVTRTPHTQPWYPPMPWDWFYGPGYWWFGCDYAWYPGWRNWGCSRPMPFWWPERHTPPELVAEQEVEIGEDGAVKVRIDTSLAKALHGDQNHRYEITAEVTDQSRRTIVGTGEVLVAREPFKVHSWVDRGYYRVGDTVQASFQARRIDGKPVEGKGALTLFRIGYEDGKPKETPVQEWRLDTGFDGHASQQLTAGRAGQYRLSYKVTDSKDHAIEGGYLFTIVGEGFDSAQFRFNHLELVPDKQDYAPGEKVRLQINTDRPGGTVLLFVRPTNGVYLPPEVLRLDGKSTVHEIEVVKRDMPNFFIEAVTLTDSAVHVETKEIAVPPEKRVLNVAIEPSKESYKPGEKAKVRLMLTDFTGEPFTGSAVVTIYDKSVEYVAGGSNVPEIKEFFWKWRRSHHPSTESSLARWRHNLLREGGKGMANIGVFGATVAEEMDGLEAAKGGGVGKPMGGRNGRMGEMAFGAAQDDGMVLRSAAPMAAMADAGAMPAAEMAAA